ncbi:hypothetical protein pb186bvf_001294 [Paramecium bursaria]
MLTNFFSPYCLLIFFSYQVLNQMYFNANVMRKKRLLIFVFDVENEGQKANEELDVFQSIISTLATYSPNSNVFILIHKFDKIKESERKAVYERKHKEISQRADNINVQIKDVFATSIWDETLYKAWSFIVQSLIPNIEVISKSLQQLNDICSCDEVVLFEKSTFLIISFHTLVNNKSADVNKYERLANIIKQFKLSCKKVDMQIKTIQVRQSKFTTYIDEFTDNTFIMLVYFDQSIQPSSVIHNIQQAKLMFEQVQGYDADKLKLLLGK